MMWHAFESNAAYLAALSAKIIGVLHTALDNRGEACLAVSGGHSPIALFEALSQEDIAWAGVHVRLVDERFVPPASADSNEHLVRAHLLQGRARAAEFTGLVSDSANIERSVQQANLDVRRPDLAILGMGDDGHTASLFPRARQLAEGLDRHRSSRYLHVTPPTAPHERISMTLPALLGARQLILTISGAQKRTIFETARRAANPDYPVSYVLNQDITPIDVYWHP